MGNYQENIVKQLKDKLKENEYGDINEEVAKEKGDTLTEVEKETLGRLNFNPETRIKIGARVGFICSYPGCNQATLGPDAHDGFCVLGEAAHIYGAVKPRNGETTRIPRPAPYEITEEYIKSAENGIWLCRHHHKLIDTIWSDKENTPEYLKQMRDEAVKRQKNALIEKNHTTIEKFFEKLPDNLCGGFVPVKNFGNSEWLLILYADRSNGYYSGDFSFGEYQEWILGNDIGPEEAGLELDYNDHLSFKNYDKISKNLAGIVSFQDNFTNLRRGKHFDSLISDLKEIDKDYKEKMLEEMSRKYPD